jgi:hypothetical protein
MPTTNPTTHNLTTLTSQKPLRHRCRLHHLTAMSHGCCKPLNKTHHHRLSPRRPRPSSQQQLQLLHRNHHPLLRSNLKSQARFNRRAHMSSLPSSSHTDVRLSNSIHYRNKLHEIKTCPRHKRRYKQGEL